MQIDPSIPLNAGRGTVQVMDPLEAYGRALNIANAVQQRRAQALQLKSIEMAQQQQQQDMQDQEHMRRAYMESGGKIEAYQKRLAELGVSPRGILGIQQSINQTRKSYADMAKSQSDLLEKRNDRLRGRLEAIRKAKPELRAAAWRQHRGEAIAMGEIDKQSAALISEDYPGEDELALLSNGLAMGSQLRKEADAERLAAASESRASSAASTAKTAMERWSVEKPGAEAKTEFERTKNAASQLAASPDAKAYKLIWDELPAGIAKKFDAPEAWDVQKSPARARNVGQTPHEQAIAQSTAETRKQTKAHQDVIEKQGWARIGQAAERLRGANSPAAKKLDDLKKQADQLTVLRNRLAQSLRQGNKPETMFVDRLGNLTPLAGKSGDALQAGEKFGTAEQAQRFADMQERYKGTTQTLRRIVTEANKLLADTKQYSPEDAQRNTEEALAALDAGDQELLGGGAAPAKSEPTGGPLSSYAPQNQAGKPKTGLVEQGPPANTSEKKPTAAVPVEPPPSKTQSSVPKQEDTTKPGPPKPSVARPSATVKEAKGVVEALRRANVPFDTVDVADGLPIIVKNGRQYKVTSVDPDGTVHGIAGQWGPVDQAK